MKSKKGMISAVFNLKETLVGKKKKTQEATSIIDPETRKEVNSVAEIKRVSLQYCKNLLKNRAPRPGFEEILHDKTVMHELRMKEVNQADEITFTKEMFNSALQRLSSNHPNKYKFILKGGTAYLSSLYTLMKSVWDNEKIPTLWKQTEIVQIYKGKGSMADLSNYRNIHTKIDTRKLFGDIVTTEVKHKISENISKFQIGAIAGHRAQEHLFTIKSVISYYKNLNKGLILCLYDISKYFDKENLKDCMGELHKHGVKGKVYILVYNLNK